MWTYHEERDQCYMHQFTKEQPDLNYRMENGKIVQEMMDVLTYWMDLGADGFRVDAINHLYESASFTNQQMFDETADPALYDNYNNMYTKDLVCVIYMRTMTILTIKKNLFKLIYADRIV